MEERGFTLVELLVVISVTVIIAALTIPVGINFYKTQLLDETTSDILSTLRRARSQSIFQKNDSSFGVKFLSGSYVLFQGVTYAARVQDEDESFSLSIGISISGIDEVVFSKLSGTTTAGTLTITSDNDNQNISINVQGKIEI